VLWLPKALRTGELTRRTRIEGRDLLDRLRARGRGIILVLGHQMNWEWAGVASTRAGIPLNSVYRPIENPWIDRALNGFRRLAGQKVITKYESASSYVDVLRRNEFLSLLADQDAHADGVFVPFFGRPASTVKGPALFALRHRAPIVCVEIWRDPDGTHHVRYGDPLEPDDFGGGREAVARMTAAYVARIETYVRRHPEQWMWLHRRWKSQPPAGKGAPEAVSALAR
jgi:KDO2-lipid IV(A) lauroyltransferase